MVYTRLLWHKCGLLEKESVSKECFWIILPSWKTELDKKGNIYLFFGISYNKDCFLELVQPCFIMQDIYIIFLIYGLKFKRIFLHHLAYLV